MKGLSTLLILGILAGSLVLGAFAKAESPRVHGPEVVRKCDLVGYVCDVATCKV